MPKDQPDFTYTEKDIGWLKHCISPERLRPYLDKARGDEWVAFHLYVRNTQLSSALYGIVQALEVSLRNVVHNCLSEKLQSAEWWDKLPLHESELNDVAEAKKNINARLHVLRPGRIVAELGFGFWVKLFANAYEKELWVPYTSRIFPAKLSRKILHDRLTALKDLRNRIAHHETLIRRDSLQDFSELLEAIGWISPTLRRWVEHHNEFQAVYDRKIPKKMVLPQTGIESFEKAQPDKSRADRNV